MRKFLLMFVLLLCVTASACAGGLYFVNPDGGAMLHADPFCPSVSVKFLPLTPVGENAERYAPCPDCWIQFALPEEEIPAADAPVTWYYNPEGGVYRHADPECRSIHSRYLPLTASFEDGDAAFDHLKDCNLCVYEGSHTLYPDCLYMKSLAVKAAAQPGVWGMPEDTHVHADVAEETALIALRDDYGVDLTNDWQRVAATFFYPKGASGYDSARYLVCVMQIGGLETLENWDLLFYATVDAESGAVRTFKGQ